MKPIETKILEMWTTWIDGRRDLSDVDAPDMTPAQVLVWFSRHGDIFPGEGADGVSDELIVEMLVILRARGYRLP